MYIGCTSNFKKRILAHRHTPWRATKKELWVKSLKELNIQPHFEVIKSIKGRELALKEERRLITLINPPLNSIL
jgi:predicted GIY-YIG superfamily endonuclease